VEAGLGFQAALGQVATLQDGPVAEEFSRVLREMQLGQSRQDALTALADRTRDEDLLRFIAAMAQVDRLGIPIAAVLREQARDMRARRRDRARERAQKVPVKIMLPVVFCFFPMLIGIVIAPAGMQIARMFSSM
jgi:tight adherence protein C